MSNRFESLRAEAAAETGTVTACCSSHEISIYTWEAFRQQRSSGHHIPVLEAGAGGLPLSGPLTLEAWQCFTGIELPSTESQVVMEDWGGAGDLSADIYFAYDQEHFYWAAKVRDNIHAPAEGSDLWRGDSIQIAFSEGGVYGPDFGISSVAGEARLWQWKEGSGTQGLDSITARTARIGSDTLYEVKMPWAAIYGKPPEEEAITFALLINDNDGGSRRGWIEWTPGFGREKDPGRHGMLHLVSAEEQGTAWVEAPREVLADERAVCILQVPNVSGETKTFQVVSRLLGTREAVTVPPHSAASVKFEFALPCPGEYKLDFQVSDEGGRGRSKNAFQTITVSPSAEELSGLLAEVESQLPVLERLLTRCEEQGIPVDYERVHAAVIRDFVEYGREDIRQGQLQRAQYVAGVLEQLHGDACRSLTDYLSGARAALPVPRYVTGRPAISGCSFRGETRVRSSGMVERRPVFFNGYGHFEQVRRDMGKFQDLGANIVQIEIGPDSVLLPGDQEGQAYAVSAAEIKRDIVRVLESAEQHHIAVNLLLSPHYFPQWALERWPELRSICSNSLHYQIDHELAQRMIEDFIRTVIPLVRDYASLHSVTLTNEPVYQTNKEARYLPAWHAYLSRRYAGKLAELNRVYDADYAAFGEIPMPPGTGASPHVYDWIVFNQELFAEWHRWMAELIRGLAPGLPVHVKIMGDPMGAPGWGIDIEAFSELSDINGNDNWNYLGEGARGYSREMSFYDLQVSLKEAPVFNSEHHIIPDGDQRYIPEHALHVRNMLWQGPLHGKSASTIWVWERTYTETEYTAGSILHRPDVVAAVGRTNHDLNRLAWEVAAFQEAVTEVVLLYSLPSMVYSAAYKSALMNAYEAVSFCGLKVGFISERQLAQDSGQRSPFILVPGASHLDPETLTGLNAYMQQGGRVILLGGDESARWTPQLQPLPAESRSALFASAEVLPLPPAAVEIRAQLLPLFEQAGLCGLKLIDRDTRQPVYDVEWRSVALGDRQLVSVINDSTVPKRVQLMRGDEVLQPVLELITGTAPEEPVQELAALTPYLFELGGGGAGT